MIFSQINAFMPEKGQYNSLSKMMPRGGLHWFSVIMLWALGVFFLYHWVFANLGTLFDPMLQNDDARQHLFAFHRYTSEKALLDDPIANEFLQQLPPLFHLLYAVLVPNVGVFIAPKIVHYLCVLIIFWSGYTLIRSSRGGIASGFLLIFCNLQASFVVERMAGGLPRSFAFPLMSLWVAGALSDDERLRFFAITLCSALYPPAALIVLVAESTYLFQRSSVPVSIFSFKKFKKIAALGLICFLLVSFQGSLKSKHAGKLPSLEQAQNDPAFHEKGRTAKLPFPTAWSFTKTIFMNVFQPHSMQNYSEIETNNKKLQEKADAYNAYFLIPCLLLLLSLIGLAPIPIVAMRLFGSALLLYILACAVAFHLYIPQRYCQFGITASALTLIISSIGMSWPRLVENRKRAIFCNLTVVICIITLMYLTGMHPRPNIGMTINGRDEPKVKAAIRQLPLNVLISGHPRDLNSVPYWTGRATVDNRETTLPWLTKSWEEKKIRVKESLFSLYSLNKEEVLGYCKKYGVTHLLLNRKRFGKNFRYMAYVFEPFDSMIMPYLRKIDRMDLVLNPETIPKDIVIVEQENLLLIEVSRLEEYWRSEEKI